MATIKSFAAPHKGLRNVISKFSFHLGYTDFNDPVQLSKLKSLGADMFTLLKDHVNTENNHTLKHLEERVHGASEHDRHDHEKLELIQDSLEHQLENFIGNESVDEIHSFYLSFSVFQSQYLEHIYEEETVTELLLQQNFTDDELFHHRAAIMQKISFPVMLLWMKYTIPAQSERESLGMLGGLKHNAPPEAFEQVLDVIAAEMDAERYKSLVDKL
ncbi:hypothetical protein ACFSJU_17420 [Paradesertivirga mongoliensis]|uniref:Hemerythrin-like domain-containing protein n=1 Tax=Paradesertivirga mongoliensis TaxID=2100740 RepID=A0ABW4ZQ91_9SPHI|nr:hypothetical protein [Pedobacter mongoliensis]